MNLEMTWNTFRLYHGEKLYNEVAESFYMSHESLIRWKLLCEDLCLDMIPCLVWLSFFFFFFLVGAPMSGGVHIRVLLVIEAETKKREKWRETLLCYFIMLLRSGHLTAIRSTIWKARDVIPTFVNDNIVTIYWPRFSCSSWFNVWHFSLAFQLHLISGFYLYKVIFWWCHCGAIVIEYA